MPSIVGLGGAMGDFQREIPAELYIRIAEELGQELQRGGIERCIVNYMNGDPLDYSDIEPGVVEVTRYLSHAFPTLNMLTASMVNRHFRQRILSIALRWDAASENPKAIYHAAVNNLPALLENALRQADAQPNHSPKGSGSRGLTPLMEAAYRGHLEAVDLLLKAGADPNVTAHFRPERHRTLFIESHTRNLGDIHSFNRVSDWTCLRFALMAPHNTTEIATLLMRSLSPESNDLSFCLAHAVAADLVHLVRPLVELGAGMFCTGSFTRTGQLSPIMHDVVSAPMVHALVAAGANVHTPPSHGLNALHAVCLQRRDCRAVIRDLITRGVNIDEATGGGSQRASLLAQPITQSLGGLIPQTALNIACRQLNLSHIKQLLELGADAMGTRHDPQQCGQASNGDYFQCSPFHDLFLPENLGSNPIAGNGQLLSATIREAISCLNTNGGSLALGQRHNVFFSNNDNAITKVKLRYWRMSYVFMPRFGMVEKLTPLDLFFMQPLVDDEQIPEAMYRNCDNVAQQINTKMELYGLTPLLALLSHRFDHSLGDVTNFYRPRLVEWLLAHGADPNLSDMEGFTPLHYAVFWLDVDAVKLLLQFGATVDGPEVNTQLTALDVAVGGIYMKEHVFASSRSKSCWKTMVRLLDANNEEESYLGMYQCLTHWTPGRQIPACTIPGFEAVYSRAYAGDDVALHPTLQQARQTGNLRSVLVQSANQRRSVIFDMLLPLTKPRLDTNHNSLPSFGDANNINGTLDWACASRQHESFVRRLVDAGFVIDDRVPYRAVSYARMGATVTQRNWFEWKEHLRTHSPHAVIDWNTTL